MKRTLVVTLVLVLIVVSITIYIYLQPRETSPVSSKKLIIYAYNDKVTGIDPSIEDDTGLVILGSIYETLTYYDYKTGSIKPRLAVNWTSSDDGLEWIFYLRQGVVFHDGTPFNATAVKISVERSRDFYRLEGKGLGYIWDAVEDIEIVDEYIVKFRLSYPQRLDLMASAAYSAYIFSPSVFTLTGVYNPLDKKLVEWFNNGNAIGTGPYRLVSYDPLREIRFERFDDWWGWRELDNPDAPDIVVVKIITEPAAQYSGLLAGEIDIASSVPRENVKDLISRGFKVLNQPTFHNFLLFFNTKRYPTNITEFRLAIAHAIDYNRIIAEALLGYGLQASGIIPRGFPGYTESLKYEYNLDKAREYLEESGVKTPISMTLMYQVDYEETRKFAELFKSIMRDLGIEVGLEPQDWIRLKDIARGVWTDPEKTPHIIIADWWPTVPTPFDYLYAILHSESREWNFAGYENPELDQLIYDAYVLEGSDIERALSLYRDAMRITYREAVVIGLWDEIRPFIYSHRVDLPEEALNPMYMYVIRFELVRVR